MKKNGNKINVLLSTVLMTFAQEILSFYFPNELQQIAFSFLQIAFIYFSFFIYEERILEIILRGKMINPLFKWQLSCAMMKKNKRVKVNSFL